MEFRKQIAFSFDSITKSKILKGALIAGTGSGAIAFLAYLGEVDWSENTFMVAFIGWVVPFATNVIREWMKGETVYSVPTSNQ